MRAFEKCTPDSLYLLVNQLDQRKITNEEMVGKVLRFLIRVWKPKVMAIKQANNPKTLDFDEFIKFLIAHEENIKELEVDNNNIKKKYWL